MLPVTKPKEFSTEYEVIKVLCCDWFSLAHDVITILV